MVAAIPQSFDQDKLGLKKFCDYLERYLVVDHEFVDGSLVVSLNAPFGQGKTSFLTMWRADLELRRKAGSDVPMAIMLNAWESDYCGDALLSVLTGLIHAVERNGDNQAFDRAAKIREATKDVAWFVTGLANSLVSNWTGVDPKAAADLAEEKKASRRKKIPDFVTLYETRSKALNDLKQSLRESVGGNVPRAFIFVDELDRCRPDFAIAYLETIKHIFDIHGLVFVLAIDFEQLSCSARALFGEGMNFPEYLRKFVHRSISLPDFNEDRIRSLCSHFASQYFHKDNKRIGAAKFGNLEGRFVELVQALNMTPRQVQETMRIIGHAASVNKKLDGELNWCLEASLYLMASLKVTSSDAYHAIGKGDWTLLQVGHFFKRLLENSSPELWFSIYLAGNYENDREQKPNAKSLFIELGFIQADSTDTVDLSRFSQGWGYSGRERFGAIYRRIEGALSLEVDV